MEENRQLREGVTTGTCAAACALASVLWQTKGICPESVSVDTPAGRRVCLEVIAGKYAECAVIKDAGDDPDITDGCVVRALVTIGSENGAVTFEAGQGIGTVTLPGLKVPVGEPAINPVPRQMIETHIRKVIGEKSARVVISIDDGERLAARTFNPRLGIIGGLSVLGTTGIVRPMSEEAVKDSLAAELSVRRALTEHLVFVPGNGAEKVLRSKYGPMPFVQISNYVGYMLDLAGQMGTRTILLAGFAGKLVKVAADIMNTHSHTADGRRETVCTFAALAGADREIIRQLYASVTTAQMVRIIRQAHLERIWQQMAEKAREKCSLRTGGKIDIAVMFLDEHGDVLGQSANTEELLKRIEKGGKIS
ncbi:MAG TPA: cobalamin biosynthesis protein CbiD [Candidatus Scybalocola faecipullorum]|nr:cobalamin biosynthesis protein CbiD [Candidatus Scybalocola faecipullorum]